MHRIKRVNRRMLWFGTILALIATAGGTYAAVSGGDDQGPPLPPAKAAIRARAAERQAALPNNPAAKADYLKHLPPQPAAVPMHVPEVGIIESQAGPFSPEQYVIENSWQEVDGSLLTQVFAGALAASPEQGLVIVRRVLWNEEKVLAVLEFPSPDRSGALRILEVKGRRLELATEHAGTLLFDVDKGVFSRP